jgi:RimJ/RimL family protein N-acetyltransferase
LKYIPFIFALAFAPTAYSLTEAQTVRLLAAIKQVESGGDCAAVGDWEYGQPTAIGCYQIHWAYWADAVEYDQTIGGCYNDCYNEQYAERVVRAYMRRYAPKNATMKDMARIHNGGPKGHKKWATCVYWAKVSKVLK